MDWCVPPQAKANGVHRNVFDMWEQLIRAGAKHPEPEVCTFAQWTPREENKAADEWANWITDSKCDRNEIVFPFDSIPLEAHLHITFDGASRGNPGPGASGVVIYCTTVNGGTKMLWRGGKYFKWCTNVQSELAAAVMSLRAAFYIWSAGR